MSAKYGRLKNLSTIPAYLPAGFQTGLVITGTCFNLGRNGTHPLLDAFYYSVTTRMEP